MLWAVREGGRPFPIQITVGKYTDGRPGEIFCFAGKSGDALEAAARDAAIFASFALQHGATLDEMVSALTYEADGKPSSMAGAILCAVKNHMDGIKNV